MTESPDQDTDEVSLYDPYEFGTGVLRWRSREQETGRYGAIYFHNPAVESMGWPIARPPDGLYGRLVAHLISVESSPLRTEEETSRLSFPTQLVLGEGRVFTTDRYEIGLHPEGVTKDERERFVAGGYPWLDPKPLRQLHNCKVLLVFLPQP